MIIERIRDWLQGKPKVGRAPDWSRQRRIHLNQFPECAVCGTRRNLDVHHVLPVHLPDGKQLELVSWNLLTLCRPHHLLVGHLCDWKSWNSEAKFDAANWRQKVRERPRSQPAEAKS